MFANAIIKHLTAVDDEWRTNWSLSNYQARTKFEELYGFNEIELGR
jgi:hypothetical protein